jgi:hypothetical protein
MNMIGLRDVKRYASSDGPNHSKHGGFYTQRRKSMRMLLINSVRSCIRDAQTLMTLCIAAQAVLSRQSPRVTPPRSTPSNHDPISSTSSVQLLLRTYL